MNIHLFSALRAVNRHLKRRRKERAGTVLSPVRRIEFVAPPASRICAMTFDDGPTAAPCLPKKDNSKGLTAHLLDTLKKYGAHATFDVIGSTAGNYPDTVGDLHGHNVFGKGYDHYACFEKDGLAGALACPELLERIVAEGHEISNHSYSHRIFGKNYNVYRSRIPMKNLDEVVADLRRLHSLVKEQTGYEMKLARPPHYIDRIGYLGKETAYDAYGKMGYHYMAANADGGGWLPSTGDYKKDVRMMVEPLERMLENNPDSLSGAIIFQKDGYNMSMQSPIADALEMQLELLGKYGYRITGVEELMKISPFEDVMCTDECLEAVKWLEEKGYTTGFKNNTFKPDEPVTQEQLTAMCTLRSKWTPRKCRDTKALSTEEIRKYVGEKFGSCPPVMDNTRRSAAIAIYESQK